MIMKIFKASLILLIFIGSCDKPTEPPVDNTPKTLKLYINEFMASNKTTIADEAGQFNDWVELYNGADTVINLNGFSITDTLGKSGKWKFPGVNILPKQWLLIWCDEDSSQGPLHANFKLSASGEELGLFTPDGKVVDTITYGKQFPDTSYGRFPDGSATWKFMPTPTPRSANK